MDNLPKFESLTVEFKSEWNDKKDGDPIKKTIVAFANTVGGDLYIGVDDNGNAVGLSHPSETEEKLANVIRDCISPSAAELVSIERVEISGKTVLRVHVDAGSMKPYCLDPKTAGGMYVRIGNTSSPASLADITRMVRQSNPVPYESRIAFAQDLTFEACQKFCATRNVSFDPKINLDFGFWDSKRKAYTNLAFLCSDQAHFAEVLIEFADDDRFNVLRSERVEGSVFTLYQAATEFIAKTNYAWMEKPSEGRAERIDHFIIEPRVILEALVNSLAHRDYSLTPANLVHITPSRILLNSVGGLAPGLSVEDFAERMVTECRNPKLAHLFSALHLMENRGSGLRRIREFYRGRDLGDLLKVTETSFTITLPRVMSEVYLEKPEYQIVLNCVSSRGEATREEIQTELGAGRSKTAVIIREMMDKNILERRAGGRSARYCVKNA